MQDLKFALRAFTRTPGASSLVVITLAVAIAAATVIASTIDMVWHFIPAVRTDGLVFVASTDPRPGQSQAGVADGLARTGVSIPDLADWTDRASTFQAFAGFTFQSAILTGSDAPSRISTVRATRNLPDVWGITPQIGRTFAADEATSGREHVVLVSHAFWQSQLSGASDATGKTLTIDGHPHTIVGVLPPSAARGMFSTIDVMVPIVLDRERAKRDERRLYVTGVLKPGIATRAGRSRSRGRGAPAADRLSGHQRENRGRRAAPDRDARRQHHGGGDSPLADRLYRACVSPARTSRASSSRRSRRAAASSPFARRSARAASIRYASS